MFASSLTKKFGGSANHYIRKSLTDLFGLSGDFLIAWGITLKYLGTFIERKNPNTTFRRGRNTPAAKYITAMLSDYNFAVASPAQLLGDDDLLFDFCFQLRNVGDDTDQTVSFGQFLKHGDRKP